MQVALQWDDAGQVGQRVLPIDLKLDVAIYAHSSLGEVQQRLHAGGRDALLSC